MSFAIVNPSARVWPTHLCMRRRLHIEQQALDEGP